MIGQPALITREQRLSMGIRTIAPFRGLFAERDVLLKELRSWVQQHGITEEGPYFLRYHVIDMNDQMDIEVGYMVSQHLAGDGRAHAEHLARRPLCQPDLYALRPASKQGVAQLGAGPRYPLGSVG